MAWLLGGSLVWESEETGEQAWERLPQWARKQIVDNKIRVFTLPGFKIARNATDRADLQLRMQGNAFLGAFFAVSPLLDEFGISQEKYREVVFKQYVKKFGKLGDAVVQSNMEVMTKGFEMVTEINIGELTAPDRSSLRGPALLPMLEEAEGAAQAAVRAAVRMRCLLDRQSARRSICSKPSIASSAPTMATISRRRRLSALGMIAAATGDTASKYVARRETPLYIPENCTQCMECIAACPDTALPNTSQELETILRTAVMRYVTDFGDRAKMLSMVPQIDSTRARGR